MKKSFYSIFLIAISFISFAQSKEDTANWIISKTSEHEIDLAGKRNYFIYEGEIIMEWYIDNKIAYIKTLPLKAITEVKIDSDKNRIQFILSCKDYCGKNKNYINDNIEKIENVKSLIIMIDANDETLINRMPKSILHLIKLNGGLAKLINQKKEPF